MGKGRYIYIKSLTMEFCYTYMIQLAKMQVSRLVSEVQSFLYYNLQFRETGGSYQKS